MIEGEYPLEVDKPPNHFGLVYDGIGEGDPGYGIKKLSYYTYKKMVEVLEGSDWDNIEIIQESDNICVYKFIKTDTGRSVWVAWNDNKEQKEITISGISSKNVMIIEIVPKYESGKAMSDYNTAFQTDTLSVSGGSVSFYLKEVPVFVEE